MEVDTETQRQIDTEKMKGWIGEQGFRDGEIIEEKGGKLESIQKKAMDYIIISIPDTIYREVVKKIYSDIVN